MKDFHGTWRLLDWTVTDENGRVTHPMGEAPVGVICYTPAVFVHVHIMRGDRVPHESADSMGGTEAEDSRSAKSHISYSGRWHLEGDKVIHDVTICSFPNWAPSRQERLWRLDGDHLELSTEPMVWAGRTIRHRLNWERLG